MGNHPGKKGTLQIQTGIGTSQSYLKSRNATGTRTSKKRYFLGNNKFNPSPSNALSKGVTGSSGLKRLPSNKNKKNEYLNVYRSSAVNRKTPKNGHY